MTDKKEKIITAALVLFANEGYNSTSTSKIAKEAGVSEGLIFRHFENKKGLLAAILLQAERKINEVFAPILFETDPQNVIRKMINLPFEIGEVEYDFWKLQFKLKWEPEYNRPEKMKPVMEKLTWAFAERQYAEPEYEARLLNQILDAVGINILRDGEKQQDAYRRFLLKKYKV